MAMHRQKIMRLQYIIEHPDQKNLYKNPPSQQRQSSIINQLLYISTQSQPQRLLKLLTQSLKYQISQNVINPSIKLNLFTGEQQQQLLETQTIIKQIEKVISYTEESKVTELKLSYNEEYLAVGGVDGLIQLYNTKDYTLYDNQYQREGQMFFHDYPIQAIEFNYSDQILASADVKGGINIWNLKNGKLLRKIDKEVSLNSICWGIDPSHLLVGYKQDIKLYGIRSCNILKQYKCSKPEFIFKLFVSQSNLFCTSTTGTLSIFNYSSSQLISVIQFRQQILSCFRLFNDNTTHLWSKLIISFGKKLVQLDQHGIEGKSYTVQDGQIQNSIAVGQFIYICLRGHDNKKRLSVMEKNKKKVVFYASLQDGAMEFMIMTRKRNLLITYDEKHKLSFWRPG